MKIKIIISLLVGYFLHFAAIEVGNLSSQYRWQECILKMRSGEVPKTLPSGTHYCLGTVWLPENIPFYEKAMLYSLDLYEKANRDFLDSLQ